MACNTAGCKSSCYRGEDDESNHLPPSENVAPSNGDASPRIGSENRRRICIKCKANDALNNAADAGDDGRFCYDCFRSNLFGKFKFAVTSNAMISPSDKVLVAYSGGPSSRVGLQFVHEMQCKAQKNFDASRDRSLPVFGVGVAFVDENISGPETKKAIEDMKSIVLELSPPEKEFHIVPVGSLYASDTEDGRDRLKELLNAVTDATGKEDLLLHMKMLSLQKIALENGYTKIVMGLCTSRIACHVITATVKGQGYSLPADIQYVDTRWEIPVVMPLRDCLARELNLLCRLDCLKTMVSLKAPCSGINGLVSSFVKLLQEENPSRESTIVRTAGKLTPFHFNKISEINNDDGHTLRRRLKKFNIKSNHSLASESFCPICSSPLDISDLQNANNSGSTNFRDACCSSCQFQILPGDSSNLEYFYSLLPKQVTLRAEDRGSGKPNCLRDQIQDYLLSDNEDGS